VYKLYQKKGKTIFEEKSLVAHHEKKENPREEGK